MSYDDWKTTPPEIDPLLEVAFEKALDMKPSERRDYLEGYNIDTSGLSDAEVLERVSDYIYEGMTEQ